MNRTMNALRRISRPEIERLDCGRIGSKQFGAEVYFQTGPPEYVFAPCVVESAVTPEDVNKALSIHWAGTFLPKHRVGNPGGNTPLFIQIGRGLYRLREGKNA